MGCRAADLTGGQIIDANPVEGNHGPSSLDLSRICAAPSARLSHLAFEGQGAFPSQC